MTSTTHQIRPALIDVLRSTLRRLEKTEDLRPDDPALIEIKSNILRAIAELELQRTSKAA